MDTYIFLRNKKYRPSSYYRIYQYLQHNQNKKVKIIEYENDNFYKKKSKNKIKNLTNILFYSLLVGYLNRIYFIIKILLRKKEYKLFIQRECFPKVIGPIGKLLLKKLLYNASKIYWDFDDNIFEVREITKYEEKLLIKYSNNIFVGNQFLLNKLNTQIKDKVTVVNTSDCMMENINLNEINFRRLELFKKEIVLVWVGTSGNLKYLKNIVRYIEEAASIIKEKQKHKQVILKVVSDGVLNIPTNYLEIRNIKWERDLAFNEMLSSHVGLMPLIDNEFTKGKCAFKAVQAIGCGLPVIVSDVGMNRDVVEKQNGTIIKDNSEWSESIVKMCIDEANWEKQSILSRNLWLEKYNSKKIKEKLYRIIDED